MFVKDLKIRKRNSFTPQTNNYNISDQHQRMFDRQQLRVEMIKTSMNRYRNQLNLKLQENHSFMCVRPTLFIRKTKEKKDQNDFKLLLQTRKQLIEKLNMNRDLIKKQIKSRLIKSAYQTPNEQNYFNQGQEKQQIFQISDSVKKRSSSIKQSPLTKKYRDAFNTPTMNDSLFPTALLGNTTSQIKNDDELSINDIIKDKIKNISFSMNVRQNKIFKQNQNQEQFTSKYQEKRNPYYTPLKSIITSKTTKSTPSSDQLNSRHIFNYNDACYLFNQMVRKNKEKYNFNDQSFQF